MKFHNTIHERKIDRKEAKEDECKNIRNYTKIRRKDTGNEVTEAVTGC